MEFINDPSLVLYLPLHQKDGSSFMSSDAYGHLCTRTGALWRFDGHFFDGTDDFVNLGSPSILDITDALTYEAWFNVAAHPSNFTTLISDRWTPVLSIRGASHNIAFWADWGGGDTMFCTGPAVTLGQWYHAVGTYDISLGSENAGLYINGSLNTTTNKTEPLTTTGETWLGKHSGGNNDPFQGRIGEVRIYNRVLTPHEIQHNYLATKWRYT